MFSRCIDGAIVAPLQAVETRLASETETGLPFYGDSVTIADICLAGVKAKQDVLKIDAAGIPVIDRIIRRCREHPAFSSAVPAKQLGASKA